VLEVLVELVLKAVTRAAGARALRTAGLDHEILNDAVEFEPIVEAVGGELFEVGNGFRRFVVEELDANVAVRRCDGGGFHGN
jgi:hypothetical protein